MANIAHLNMSEGLVKCELLFHKTVCSKLLHLASISGWCSGQLSCISCRRPGFNSPLEQQFFNFHFSQSHHSLITKPSSLKLATYYRALAWTTKSPIWGNHWVPL